MQHGPNTEGDPLETVRPAAATGAGRMGTGWDGGRGLSHAGPKFRAFNGMLQPAPLARSDVGRDTGVE